MEDIKITEYEKARNEIGEDKCRLEFGHCPGSIAKVRDGKPWGRAISSTPHICEGPHPHPFAKLHRCGICMGEGGVVKPSPGTRAHREYQESVWRRKVNESNAGILDDMRELKKELP